MVVIQECCQYCGEVKASLYQCSQCKVVSYCSKKCERKHKNEHTQVCFTIQTKQRQKLDSSSDKYAEPEVTCSNKSNKANKEHLKESSPCGEEKTFCQTCYRTNVSLKRCSRCKTVYYCSGTCEKSDWSTHKGNCKDPKTNSGVNCEKKTGSEDSSEGSNKKEQIKENCVSVDEGNSGKTDSKVNSKNCVSVDEGNSDKTDSKVNSKNCVSVDEGNSGKTDSKVNSKNCVSVDEGNSDKTDSKNKTKKKNRGKRHKKGNWDNMKTDGASGKIDIKNDTSKKDSVTETKKANSENMNCKGKDGMRDSEKETTKENSQMKPSQVNSKADIKEETGTINSEKKTEAGTSVKNTAGECEGCENFNENLMKCGRCKNARYCSKTCQIAAWPLHKKLCKSSKSSNTKSSRKKDNLKVLLNARKLFPSYDIITKFIDVPKHLRKENSLLVAYISKPGYHFFRPSFFIQDSDGLMRILIFYHKEPDPHPYFSWDQLKIGNYICILQPELHYFMDGQIGFRINSTREIRIF